MNKKRFRAVAILPLLIMIAACSDWQLRGSRPDAFAIRTAYLSTAGAPRLARALRRELAFNRVRLVTKQKAEVTVEIAREEYDRRVLSVDPDTGKVREVELELEVVFSVRANDGRELVPVEKLRWEQDYIFDESSLLGTNERANIIQRELADDAARTILLRLETIELKQP